VNAGHNPPFLFHRVDGQWSIQRLEIGGVVLGLLENFPFQQGRASFAVGDVLVAYTDGISEAMNSSDEEWGEDRMTGTLRNCLDSSAQQILQRVFSSADEFVSGAKQHDDMTLVILRVVG